jgi:hypothetical protein
VNSHIQSTILDLDGSRHRSIRMAGYGERERSELPAADDVPVAACERVAGRAAAVASKPASIIATTSKRSDAPRFLVFIFCTSSCVEWTQCAAGARMRLGAEKIGPPKTGCRASVTLQLCRARVDTTSEEIFPSRCVDRLSSKFPSRVARRDCGRTMRHRSKQGLLRWAVPGSNQPS